MAFSVAAVDSLPVDQRCTLREMGSRLEINYMRPKILQGLNPISTKNALNLDSHILNTAVKCKHNKLPRYTHYTHMHHFLSTFLSVY